MPDMSKEFGGKFLKAIDVEMPVLWTITGVTQEALHDESKWVVWFSDDDRGLVLNKTNCSTIISCCGKDSEQWIGQQIVLYKAETHLRGELVDCIRVRAPKVRKVAKKAAGPTPEVDEQDLPF